MSLLDTASLIVTPNGYKEGKLYSVIPSDGSGDLSVTRATTATRVNSAGLVELVPYNLLEYSEQFDNAYWSKYQTSVTANSTTAPDGTTTADTITDTASGGLLLQVSAGTNASAVVTQSFYFKKSNTNWVYIGISRSGSTTYGEVVKFFNLNTGAIGSTLTYGAGVFVDANIQDAGNGWYRCSLTASVPNALGYAPYFGNANADGAPFVSDIGDATFVWGAQLVEGSTAKDYQKTETRLNIPRLDYSNGTCPSLLVEPQRTNYINYSSSFDNAAWEKQLGSSVTANTTTAPDGTMSADTLTIAPNQYMYQLQGLSSGTSYTISFYCKVASGTKQFNMVTYSPSGNINYSPTLTATTEWQRFEFTITANATASTSIYPVLVDSFASGSFFIWGAQLEAGSYATSYIPTTSASVTRNADVISKTGISSLIGQTEGTLFAEIELTQLDQSCIAIRLDNGSDSGIHFYFDVNQINAFVEVSGATQASISTGAPSLGTHKLAIAYKANDVAFYVDGVLIGTDTSASIPTCSVFRINGISGGILISAFKVKATSLWKTRLTNTQLAQLTTI